MYLFVVRGICASFSFFFLKKLLPLHSEPPRPQLVCLLRLLPTITLISSPLTVALSQSLTSPLPPRWHPLFSPLHPLPPLFWLCMLRKKSRRVCNQYRFTLIWRPWSRTVVLPLPLSFVPLAAESSLFNATAAAPYRLRRRQHFLRLGCCCGCCRRSMYFVPSVWIFFTFFSEFSFYFGLFSCIVVVPPLLFVWSTPIFSVVFFLSSFHVFCRINVPWFRFCLQKVFSSIFCRAKRKLRRSSLGRREQAMGRGIWA